MIQLAESDTVASRPLEHALVWQVLDTADVGLLVTDARRRIVYVNEAFSRVTGYRLEEVRGRTCALLQGAETDPADIAFMRAALDRGEPFERVVLNYRKDGKPLWYRLRVQPMFVDGRLQYFVGVQEDYSEAHAAQRELERLAYHDGLTGLGNRRAFDLQLHRLVGDGQPFVLQLLDLDNFKQVNDRYGHPAGDALLQRVAACLTQATQGEGTAFRLGGDEFGLLWSGADRPESTLATGLLGDLVNVGGERIRGATGTARFPEEAGDVEELLRLADRRLYAQKALTQRGQAAR
ncbi:diguanylate cyclase domain-containing protein [Deinococcus marmoris]|uniref:Diguanylate cyclase/phosphodiesterase (GGDEF & EAL domains) with PAS/PAC sensor(S) n=1 Tax=Deinococcus marmoris TaxID=249408 RepID=A0A1U7P2Q3_9DEIO|nr:diguanylate cyclase [Deinococcus marmoris]OLV19438.1 diguanylate cyclase/phosphodiesterase (GGDEF & EAL domains) with PAS/PAC sensor(s) [Deinococcus marmoris]